VSGSKWDKLSSESYRSNLKLCYWVPRTECWF